jgi:hypothetical protein
MMEMKWSVTPTLALRIVVRNAVVLILEHKTPETAKVSNPFI